MASRPSKTEPSGSGKRKALFLESPGHLIYRAHQLVADSFATGADPAALTMRQYVLLSAIAIHGGASQSDLVRKTGIDRSTLAEMIARLQSRGLVDRGRTAKDGRTKSVRITPEGKKAIEEALPRAERADKALLTLLSKRRRAHLMEILLTITESVEDKKKIKDKKSKAEKTNIERPDAEITRPDKAGPATSKAGKKGGKSGRRKVDAVANPVIAVVADLESALSAPAPGHEKKPGTRNKAAAKDAGGVATGAQTKISAIMPKKPESAKPKAEKVRKKK